MCKKVICLIPAWPRRLSDSQFMNRWHLKCFTASSCSTGGQKPDISFCVCFQQVGSPSVKLIKWLSSVRRSPKSVAHCPSLSLFVVRPQESTMHACVNTHVKLKIVSDGGIHFFHLIWKVWGITEEKSKTVRNHYWIMMSVGAVMLAG